MGKTSDMILKKGIREKSRVHLWYGTLVGHVGLAVGNKEFVKIVSWIMTTIVAETSLLVPAIMFGGG